MEWIILIVILPLILIPIVLLTGFAGCGEFLPLSESDPPVPAAPSDLIAVVKSSTSIELTWKDNTAGASKFEVRRQPNVLTVATALISTPPSPFLDTGLTPDTSYTYSVKALDPSTNSFSAASNEVTVKTLPASTGPGPTPQWEAVYNEALTTDAGGNGGYCLVQRITGIQTGGERVRVTLGASVAAALAVDRVFISAAADPEPGNPTPNPWDSPSAGLRDLRPGGLYIPKNGSLTLDPIDFHVDPNKDLIVAFDINQVLGQTRKAMTTQTAFNRASTAEANVANRQAGYATLTGTYLIKTIEVFPAPAPPPVIIWKQTYGQPIVDNVGGRQSSCIVQRINAARLSSSGTRVRLTLRSGSSGPLVIRRIFLSRPAVAGEPGNPAPQPWDSSSLGITEVRLGGAAMPANTSVTLDPVAFAVDETKDLMVSFDIAEVGGNTGEVSLTGPVYYMRPNTEEAGVANRQGGYATFTDKVCVVEKIEVEA
jgi:hypothetical protein